MPKLTRKVPSYRLHKRSGQAVVTLDSRDHYLGRYGTSESHDRYRRHLTAWVASRSANGNSNPGSEPVYDLRIDELLVAYLEFAQGYYVKGGRPTGEVPNIKDAIKPLTHLYGHARVLDFTPTSLKAVRQVMIEAPPIQAPQRPRI